MSCHLQKKDIVMGFVCTDNNIIVYGGKKSGINR